MIIEHEVVGSEETTAHDFVINIESNRLSLSSGSYTRNKKKLFELTSDVTLYFESHSEDKYYEVWVTKSGVRVIGKDETVFYPIDCLVWMNIPANTEDLSQVEVNFRKIVTV